MALENATLVINGKVIGSGSGDGGTKAENVSYDNSGSGLDATNAQEAIDEIVEKISPFSIVDGKLCVTYQE